MSAAVVQLQEVVTTATGEQRKVELGNAISTLGDVNKRVETVADQFDVGLARRQIARRDRPSESGHRRFADDSRARRFIDQPEQRAHLGRRRRTVLANTTSSSGANSLSLLNNLSPEEIEDIEIVKGPSAATLYGTNAANGVIVVTTKKGRSRQREVEFQRRVAHDRRSESIPGAVRQLRPHAGRADATDSLPAFGDADAQVLPRGRRDLHLGQPHEL